MKIRSTSKNRSGFTLVELLVVISIIAVLAALAAGGLKSAERSSHRAAALGNLRQIGAAMSMYIQENDHYLPGPLFPGQLATYSESKKERLTVKLAKYLGGEEVDGAEVPVFIPPAFRRTDASDLLSDTADGARTMVVNMKVPKDGAIVNPWGMSGAQPQQQASKLIDLMDPDSDAPVKTWALSDADQEHPHVSSAPWKAKTTVKPYHGDKRAALFFDWHAELKEQDFFNAPAPTP